MTLLLCTSMDDWSQTVMETGRPYCWVQWLCGLQFLDDDPTKLSVGLSRGHMSETVQRLRARVSHRLSLQKQLVALGLSRPMLSKSVAWQKVKTDIALPGNPISGLRDVTCRMGLHSVTYHPTQVNAPRQTPNMQVGTRFTYLGGMEG